MKPETHKAKCKFIVVKKSSLARILCMCHISMPSVKSSRRHQRSCERKASAFADTEHTTASDSLFIPERDRALLFHLYLHPTGRLIRNRKPPDVLLHANAGNFTCSFSSPLLSFRLTLELVMSPFSWLSSPLILRPRAGEFISLFLLFERCFMLHALHASQKFGIITIFFMCFWKKSLLLTKAAFI